MAEQAEERIWMRVHHAANIDAAQPQDVLKCAAVENFRVFRVFRKS